MQVPASIHALWMQRKRWARGQGEVLHVHLGEVTRWRNHRMWMLGFEGVASLVWVFALGVSLVIAVLGVLLGESENVFGFALAWGVAIAFVATVQMIVALTLEHGYDRSIFRRAPRRRALPDRVLARSPPRCSPLRDRRRCCAARRDSRVVWNIPRQAARRAAREGVSPRRIAKWADQAHRRPMRQTERSWQGSDLRGTRRSVRQ